MRNMLSYVVNEMRAVGNIRLSNSAESVQYPVRRPSARRLVGLNVPRQYPLRSSLRRHKEKQIGSNLLMGSNGKCTTNIDIDSNQPPSVRNSIAECCSSISSMPHSSSGNILMPTISCNRLPTHASSLENRLALSGVHDICSSNSNSTLMDITEPTKSNVSASGSNMLIYRAPMVSNIPTMNKKPVAVQMSQQQQSEDTTISTKITFKAPRI